MPKASLLDARNRQRQDWKQAAALNRSTEEREEGTGVGGRMWSEQQRKGPKTGCVGAERGGEGAEWEAGEQPEPRQEIPQRIALGIRQLWTNSEQESDMDMFVLGRWPPLKW